MKPSSIYPKYLVKAFEQLCKRIDRKRNKLPEDIQLRTVLKHSFGNNQLTQAGIKVACFKLRDLLVLQYSEHEIEINSFKDSKVFEVRINFPSKLIHNKVK